MPIMITARNNKHFDLFGIDQDASPEFEAARCKKKIRKSVRFNEVVEIRPILHSNDLSDEEFFNTWYQQRDFQMMRVELWKTLSKISAGTYEGDSNTETTRGLEYRTNAGSQRRQLNKANALRAVLDEQAHGVDCEALRDAYLRRNRHCAKEARELAICDEEDALDIYIRGRQQRRRDSEHKSRR
mmetsp:Transcript_25514/g.59278  ORF Transcript_25514/g.59278 Transcript_25514/m.59278 type:complete len:185 (-) Transcript_25514:158-712(-)